MANNRDQSRSTAGGIPHAHGPGHSRHSSKHSSRKQQQQQQQQHRVPSPPDPPAHAGLAQAPPPVQRVTAACQDAITSTAEPVPAVDPEALPAKRGLNEWGAFTGGTGYGEGGGGTFGFGPLLFHKNKNNENNSGSQASSEAAETDGSASSPTQTRQEWPSTVLTSLETDRLVLNDPLSFNPLAAIGWARLDAGPAEDERPAQVDLTSCGDDGGSVSQPHSHPPVTTAKGNSRQGGRSDRGKGAYNVDAVAAAAAPMSAALRGLTHSHPSPSPLGNMSETFSAALQAPDMADRCITYIPSSQQPSASGQQPQMRKKRKHRHRHGAKISQSEPSTSSSSSSADAYVTTCPSPLSQAFSSSMASYQAHQPFIVEPQVMPLPDSNPHPHHQATIPRYQVPAHAIPRQQQYEQQQDLFLCLCPHCSARFPTEAQLSTHYRREHSLACSWTSCAAAGFTSNHALAWHVKAEHLLLCPVPGCCDRVFANRRELDGHVRVR